MDEFEDLHEGVDKLVHLETPNHYLLQVHQRRHDSVLLQLVELELHLLEEIHHVHVGHQDLQGMQSFLPVLLDDGLAFSEVEFLLAGQILHFLERGVEVLELYLAVNAVVRVPPPSFFDKHLIDRSLGPVGPLQQPEESVEVYLPHQCLLPMPLRDLLAKALILHFPVKVAILRFVCILVEVRKLEAILDPSDLDWPL